MLLPREGMLEAHRASSIQIIRTGHASKQYCDSEFV